MIIIRILPVCSWVGAGPNLILKPTSLSLKPKTTEKGPEKKKLNLKPCDHKLYTGARGRRVPTVIRVALSTARPETLDPEILHPKWDF